MTVFLVRKVEVLQQLVSHSTVVTCIFSGTRTCTLLSRTIQYWGIILEILF